MSTKNHLTISCFFITLPRFIVILLSKHILGLIFIHICLWATYHWTSYSFINVAFNIICAVFVRFHALFHAFRISFVSATVTPLKVFINTAYIVSSKATQTGFLCVFDFRVCKVS